MDRYWLIPFVALLVACGDQPTDTKIEPTIPVFDVTGRWAIVYAVNDSRLEINNSIQPRPALFYQEKHLGEIRDCTLWISRESVEINLKEDKTYFMFMSWVASCDFNGIEYNVEAFGGGSDGTYRTTDALQDTISFASAGWPILSSGRVWGDGGVGFVDGVLTVLFPKFLKLLVEIQRGDFYLTFIRP